MFDAINIFVYNTIDTIVDNVFDTIVNSIINAIVNNIIKLNKTIILSFHFETRVLRYKTSKNCNRESKFLLSNKI